ncbi:hypothetical protein V1477_013428 [Vespula maculifrons]|uniref:Uncharacterized protein n=1 Tax=Vespula maculifrons TaxID=7453 RepID=A0ABD2BQH3_VESMC
MKHCASNVTFNPRSRKRTDRWNKFRRGKGRGSRREPHNKLQPPGEVAQSASVLQVLSKPPATGCLPPDAIQSPLVKNRGHLLVETKSNRYDRRVREEGKFCKVVVGSRNGVTFDLPKG